MTTQDYITKRLIDALEQLSIDTDKCSRQHARRKLTEIAQSCPNVELASRAHKILVDMQP